MIASSKMMMMMCDIKGINPNREVGGLGVDQALRQEDQGRRHGEQGPVDEEQKDRHREAQHDVEHNRRDGLLPKGECEGVFVGERPPERREHDRLAGRGSEHACAHLVDNREERLRSVLAEAGLFRKYL